MGIVQQLILPPAISKKAIYDILSAVPNEVILFLMAYSKHPDIKRYISLYFTQLKNVRILVTGQDLIRLGYVPGPHFKTIFDAVLERKLSGGLQSKAEEIEFVLGRFPQVMRIPANPPDRGSRRNRRTGTFMSSAPVQGHR